MSFGLGYRSIQEMVKVPAKKKITMRYNEQLGNLSVWSSIQIKTKLFSY
jgi:hypothetical protein